MRPQAARSFFPRRTRPSMCERLRYFFLAVLHGGALAFLPGATLQAAALPWPQDPTSESEVVTPLVALLDSRIDELPEAHELGVMCLVAGAEGTASFLSAFESRAVTARKNGEPLDALASLSHRLRRIPTIVRQTLDDGVPGSMRNEAVGVALEILVRDVSAETLKVGIQISRAVEPAAQDSFRGLGPRYEAWARAVADANVATPRTLGRLIDAVAVDLRASIVDGIATSRDARLATRQLLGLLDHTSDLDGALLNRLMRVARSHRSTIPTELASPVRSRLASPDPFIRREAAFALGAIGDTSSIPDLIARLDDEQKSVREAAHDSLCQLTSLKISADPHRWRRWLEKQERWWNEHGQEILARIPRAELGDLVDLVAEVADKRLHRDTVARSLIPLTRRKDPRYVELAISALGVLRSPIAVSAIHAHVGSDNALIAKRAAAALSSLNSAGIHVPLFSRTARP